jgi:phosphohistidine swiveling domain-containing protein
MKQVFTWKSATLADPIGQKAKNLLLLQEAGLNVPPWFVISSKIKEFTSELEQSIEEALLELGLYGAELAVRSSADLEDTAGSSFAGMYDSFLYVKSSNLKPSIEKVWTSANSLRVQEYLRERFLTGTRTNMSVLIQKMVSADASGVGFGLNPVNLDFEEIIISSVYGLGEGLVSGALDADRFNVRGLQIEREVTEKKTAFYRAENEGIIEQPVAPHLVNSASLNDQQIIEIAQTLKNLELNLKAPQDVEFAVESGVVYFLQTRPITSLKNTESSLNKNGAITHWDNNNIIESYPGTTTPLTYSFVRKTYQVGYMQLCEMFGVDRALIQKNQALFGEMIGLIQNRMYYNLNHIFELVDLLPGSKSLRKSIEDAIGIDEFRKTTDFRSKFYGRAIIAMFYQFWHLKKNRLQFVEELDAVLTEMNSANLDRLEIEELFKHYHDLERRVFSFWRAPVVNGLFTMMFFGMLKRFNRYSGLNRAFPNIQNELMVGQNNIISTVPITKIFEMTRQIRNHPEAFSLFTSESPKKIWKLLEDKKFQSLKSEVQLYLENFGERCVGGELKLENPSYRDHPELFIKILKSYLEQDIKFSFDHNKSDGIRKSAEDQVRVFFKFKPVRAFIFKKLLHQCREMVVWRENLRFKRTQAFGLVKSIFNEIGVKFHLQGLIKESRDIFFLTQDEIFAAPRSSNENLENLVTKRKEDFLRNSNVSLPSRIMTRGEGQNLKILTSPSSETISTANVVQLKGTGCSSGVIRGRAKVVKSPDELDHLQGDILVAESTDPGWVKLFPTASAILLERGSLLSHAGIVTREMGIPCIVGVKGLLSAVKDKDLIEMDGSLGTIRILRDHD